MVKKVYKKLSSEQKARGIVFASTLSRSRTESAGDTTHEVHMGNHDKNANIARLKDDRFFNKSSYKYNIIRK